MIGARLASTAPIMVAAAALLSGGVILAAAPLPLAAGGVAALAVGMTVVGFGASRIPGVAGAAVSVAALAVFVVTWNGLKVPGGTVADPLFLVAATLCGLVVLRGQSPPTIPVWMLASAYLFTVAALLAALFPPDPLFVESAYRPSSYVTAAISDFGQSSDEGGYVRFMVAAVAVPVVLSLLVSTPRRARVFASLWLASAAVSALVATLDQFGFTTIGTMVTGLTWQEGRQAGLAIQPNHLGLTCTMAMPVAVLGAMTGPGRTRMIHAGALGLLVLGLLASGSRTALGAAAFGVLLVFVLVPELRQRAGKAAYVGGVALIVFAALAPPWQGDFAVAERLSASGATTHTSDQLRGQIVNHAVGTIEARPLVGSGFSVISDAHNLLLQVLQAAGILGLVAFLVYVGGMLRTGLWLGRDAGVPPDTRGLMLALSAGLAAWLVFGMFQPPISDRYLYVPVGILLGIAASRRQVRSFSEIPRADPRGDSGRRPPAPAGVGKGGSRGAAGA